MADDKVRARDISAPTKEITLDGVRYELAFTNTTARVAEDVYERIYKRDIGYGEILSALVRGKYGAVMAVLYGAVVAGGANMEWQEFDTTFKLDSIDGIRELIAAGITASLPEDDGEDANPQMPRP